MKIRSLQHEPTRNEVSSDERSWIPRSGQFMFIFVNNLPELLRLYVQLVFDGQVPWSSKVVLMLALMNGMALFDLVPDWALPQLGEVDDLTVSLIALNRFIVRYSQPVLDEYISRLGRRDEMIFDRRIAPSSAQWIWPMEMSLFMKASMNVMLWSVDQR